MTTLPRNDVRRYDLLADEWRRPDGAFSALHWLAESRARLIPPGRGGLLVDVGCGGGIMAGHVEGYRHVGVDLSRSALEVAATAGVTPVRADASSLPIASGAADVVVAGELFEHVEDLDGVVGEVGRVLRPGGLLVFDTINRTALARLTLVTLGERVPGGPPPGLHDPRLFVPVRRLRSLLEGAGLHRIDVWGLRPHLGGYVRHLAHRRRPVEMVRTRQRSVLYQGIGWRR